MRIRSEVTTDKWRVAPNQKFRITNHCDHPIKTINKVNEFLRIYDFPELLRIRLAAVYRLLLLPHKPPNA